MSFSPSRSSCCGPWGSFRIYPGLEAGVRSGLPLYYRPAPSLGWQTKQAAAMLGRVLDAYPVAAVTPAGESVSGYPDVGPLAAEPGRRGIPVAMVEFSRQLGAVALNNLSAPLLLPLHSVTNEKLLTRNIGRQAHRQGGGLHLAGKQGC